MNIQDLRDLLISIYLILGILLTLVLVVGSFFIVKALLGLIRAAKRPLDNFGVASEAIIEHVVEPLKEGVSIGSVMGGSLSFVTGFLGGLTKRTFGGKSSKDKDKKSKS